MEHLVCALVPLGTGWEAGEMPALPRNCKRDGKGAAVTVSDHGKAAAL
jgi:hypothetical protein